MAESVFNAFIIDISDFQVYDQIINVLLQDNTKRGLICLGTKKILSKNSRSIALLNLVEIEAFLSNSNSKLSKLKKLNAIEKFEFEWLNYSSIKTLLRYINQTVELKLDFYNFINEIKEDLNKNINDLILLSKVYRMIFKDLGLKFYFKSCCNCGSKYIYTISISNSGLVCKNCNFNKEIVYPLWFIKNFFYFMHNENKIKNISSEQSNFFYTNLNKILKSLIKENAGFE